MGERLAFMERWRARTPLHAYVLMTSRCSMSCEDCYFVDIINKKDVGRLDFDLKQIKENYDDSLFRAVSRVILFGGEPTLCKDIVETIRFFRSRGVVVSMTTNSLHTGYDELVEYRSAGLNMLNLSVYEETGRGVLRNLEYIEKIFAAAYKGAFDLERIEVSYHAVEVEKYRSAYEFALKIGARHLLFNRTFYTDTNPRDGDCGESDKFEQQYFDLCQQIIKENRLNLYHASLPGDPVSCSFTANAFSISPTNELSPCCQVTPSQEYGEIDKKEALFAFKDMFIAKQVPNVCRDCHLLGLKHF